MAYQALALAAETIWAIVVSEAEALIVQAVTAPEDKLALLKVVVAVPPDGVIFKALL